MSKIQTVALEQVSRVFMSETDRTGGVARFVALENISVSFSRGKLHMLLGENGAGKSTLVHILSGLDEPTEGAILVDSVKTVFKSPAQALERGISMVHQRPLLADDLTVLENISLAGNGFLIGRRSLRHRIEPLMRKWKCDIDLSKPARNLSPADRLHTALLCALVTSPSFLILDEPTAILPPEERASFMEVLAQSAKEGMGVLVITHKMQEAAQWGDTISVLQKGKLVRYFDQKKQPVTEEQLVDLFRSIQEPSAGKNFHSNPSIAHNRCTSGLSVSNLSASPPDRAPIKNISFSAEPGTITGILAYPGSGLDTLEEILSGMLAAESGTLTLSGDDSSCISLDARTLSPAKLRRYGIALVPSNRTIRGSHPDISIHDALIPYKSGHFHVNRRTTGDFVHKQIMTNDIADHPFRPVRTLSGGQLQKLILSRELSTTPRVLILSDPEWGLDMANTERLRNTLTETAKSGVTIIILTDTPDTMENHDFFTTTRILREGVLS